MTADPVLLTRPRPATWIAIFAGVLLWSGIEPKDTVTWMLEVAPAVIAAIVLLATRRRFPLTRLAYALILVHCIILMIGGHYTYALVPLGDWVREALDQTRNNYDKLGHFAQGFVPAIVAREVVIRLRVFNSANWRNFFIVCFCLGFSAFYELIEWWVALLSEEAADSFLGTQGYAWDTQSDMGWALLGAILANNAAYEKVADFLRPALLRSGNTPEEVYQDMWGTIIDGGASFGCATAVTNVDPRTFPAGQSVEVLTADALERVIANGSLVDLTLQMDALQRETAAIRGQSETLAYEAETTASRQREPHTNRTLTLIEGVSRLFAPLL